MHTPILPQMNADADNRQMTGRAAKAHATMVARGQTLFLDGYTADPAPWMGQLCWIVTSPTIMGDFVILPGFTRLHCGRPTPCWTRGSCPQCGDDLVCNIHHVNNQGYLMVYECWSSLGANPTCDFRKVL